MKFRIMCPDNHVRNPMFVIYENLSNLEHASTSLYHLLLPQRPAGVPVYLRALVAEEPHQGRDAPELPGLGFDRVIHVAEVLEIGRGVGLDH